MVNIFWNRQRPLVLTLTLTSLMLLSMFAALPSSAQSSGNSQLTVSSQDINSQSLNGYYTVLYQNGNALASGFTPATYTLNNGQSYVIRADGYRSCVFSSWLDSGSTNALRSISITGNTHITAVYNCGSAAGSAVTINSEDQNGNPISGYYTVLYDSSGNLLTTGFTPKTFVTTPGQTYAVRAEGYRSCTFSHWSDGVSSDPRTFTSGASKLALTSVYNCGTSPPPISSSVSINSVNQAGGTITGYYTVLYSSSGEILATGFTVATFSITIGATYGVRAESYGSCVFSGWSDGIATNPRSFTAKSGGQSFTSVYKCGETKGTGSSGITVTANRIPASYWAPCFATTCSRGTGPGASMYFDLYNSSGGLVATGFADEHGFTFTGLNKNATYYVYPADCDSCHGSTHDVIFQYWATNAGIEINSTRPLAVTVGETVNAWYSCTNGCGGG